MSASITLEVDPGRWEEFEQYAEINRVPVAAIVRAALAARQRQIDLSEAREAKEAAAA